MNPVNPSNKFLNQGVVPEMTSPDSEQWKEDRKIDRKDRHETAVTIRRTRPLIWKLGQGRSDIWKMIGDSFWIMQRRTDPTRKWWIQFGQIEFSELGTSVEYRVIFLFSVTRTQACEDRGFVSILFLALLFLASTQDVSRKGRPHWENILHKLTLSTFVEEMINYQIEIREEVNWMSKGRM